MKEAETKKKRKRGRRKKKGRECEGRSKRSPNVPKLKIVHLKRQSGKSLVPVKQRGSWPKMCSN